jgi:hypothetical protein
VTDLGGLSLRIGRSLQVFLHLDNAHASICLYLIDERVSVALGALSLRHEVARSSPVRNALNSAFPRTMSGMVGRG